MITLKVVFLWGGGPWHKCNLLSKPPAVFDQHCLLITWMSELFAWHCSARTRSDPSLGLALWHTPTSERDPPRWRRASRLWKYKAAEQRRAMWKLCPCLTTYNANVRSSSQSEWRAPKRRRTCVCSCAPPWKVCVSFASVSTSKHQWTGRGWHLLRGRRS